MSKETHEELLARVASELKELETPDDKKNLEKLISNQPMPQAALMADYIKRLEPNIPNPGIELARHRQALEDGNKQQLDEAKAQNEKLSNLLKAKDTEATDSKKYNRKMMWIAIGAGIIAAGSLVANIIMIYLMT